jgi:DNA polymerase-3 subunit epsilon
MIKLTDAQRALDRHAAITRAGNWLKTKGLVLLDTETTGFHNHDRIIQISIISISGETLMDTLINPEMTIPPEATAVNQITDDMVASARTFRQVYPELCQILDDTTVCAYNADFDARMITQECNRTNLRPPMCTWVCAMKELAAPFEGQIGKYGDYAWPKLTGGDHTALGDCWAMLGLIKKIAGTKE